MVSAFPLLQISIVGLAAFCVQADYKPQDPTVPKVLVTVTQSLLIADLSCPDELADDNHLQSDNELLVYDGLHFLMSQHNTSTTCEASSSGAKITTVTSVIVCAKHPHHHCSTNATCLEQFNNEQLAKSKQFFQKMLAAVPAPMDPIVNVETHLLCTDGQQLDSTGACVEPAVPSGDCVCGHKCPVDMELMIAINSSSLAITSCTELLSTQLTDAIEHLLTQGQNLILVTTGELMVIGQPSVECTQLDDTQIGVVVSVQLQLSLARNVRLCTKDDLSDQIKTAIGTILNSVNSLSVGDSQVDFITFIVDLNETSISADDCPPRPTEATECLPGNYLENANCVACPVGTYTDEPDQMSCTKCPDKHTTYNGGASSIDDCVTIECPVGHFSSTGYDPCEPCPIEKYQDTVGQKTCKRCFPGIQTTRNVGSTSRSDCIRISSAPIVIPPCPVEHAEVLPMSGGCYTTPNYPNKYNTCEKRTSVLTCKNTQRAAVLILGCTLGYGDSLTVQSQTFRSVNMPVPIIECANSSITIQFNSDQSLTDTGCKIVYTCYENQQDVDSFMKAVASDCNALKYLQDNPSVIDDLFKVLRGEVSLAAAATNSAYGPLITASLRKGQPCPGTSICF